MSWPEHIAGSTTHARRGSVKNAFRYGVDYVLVDPDETRGPALFSRNRMNLTSVHDRHHGGPRSGGQGAAWAWSVLAGHGYIRQVSTRLRLLTQPRFLGYLFNPVSFWMVFEDDDLVAVIAEVNNTFGDRHSYLCRTENWAPITPNRQMTSEKLFHVSPFQQVAGSYAFNFAVTDDHIAIRILHENGDEGVIATLHGPRRELTNRAILGAALRRPFGPLRVIALIYWQAIVLKLKGAPYSTRPLPPTEEVS